MAVLSSKRARTMRAYLNSNDVGLSSLRKAIEQTNFSIAITSFLFNTVQAARNPTTSHNTTHPVPFVLDLIPLCLLVLEYIGTCRFEFTYIWSRPLSISKVLFIVSRYYEIVGKSVHYCLIHLILGRSPAGISPQTCAIWYTLMFSQSVIMVLILDVVLFLRAPYVFGTHKVWFLWTNQGEVFDGVCNVYLRATSRILVLLIGNLGQGQVPVVKLVVREGSWIFIVLFAIVAALLPSSIAVNTENPFVIFVCPTTLVSVLNCRIIQNMHNIAINEASRRSPCNDNQDFQLTTFIHSDFVIDS
ncbi:hypothetical protein BJ165DRAFT_1411195 [Panaeolus papilionaceus]|nr:hypothetical protein BJ165DRAFT_1411195 [Panaeolus papilionaceus]